MDRRRVQASPDAPLSLLPLYPSPSSLLFSLLSFSPSSSFPSDHLCWEQLQSVPAPLNLSQRANCPAWQVQHGEQNAGVRQEGVGVRPLRLSAP